MQVSGISLPNELASFVQQQITDGNFASEGEVLCAGLWLLRERTQSREARLAELRALIEPAIAQLDRGEGVPLDIEDIKAYGRQSLAQTERDV